MPRLLRRAVAAPVAVFALATSALVVTAAPALADNSSTLTVVGTSDVFDSNLVQTVIKPGFEAANPGITLNYISKGTGAAIAYAEQGSASAMVVHAASLENQFVAQGYSLENYGRAIFWGDFVLLGPASDPAKVGTGAKHDIVTAFEKVAAAGVAGKANFISRGGTPGTTVQEHALWALSHGVPTCTVSDVNGGGTAPSTTSGACPAVATNPSWYQTTGLTQGPNVLNASACNYPGGGCYVFTDRGTYEYLRSTGQAQNLKILTQTNGTKARGGLEALVNSFHAYAVNPQAFPAGTVRDGINVTQATNFLNYITSPPAQTAIGNYLANSESGAPFLPDAAPRIDTNGYPTVPVAVGTPIKVTGTVTNVVPGTPKSSGVTVRLRFTPAGGSASQPVGTAAVTNANGAYTLTYKPFANGTYTVTSDPVDKIERPDLTPVFGDKLQGGTSAPSAVVEVIGSATIVNAAGHRGYISGQATVNPAVTSTPASLVLYAGLTGNPLTKMSSPVTIPVGNTRIGFRYDGLAPGTYTIQLHYVNDGVIEEGASGTTSVTVT